MNVTQIPGHICRLVLLGPGHFMFKYLPCQGLGLDTLSACQPEVDCGKMSCIQVLGGKGSIMYEISGLHWSAATEFS